MIICEISQNCWYLLRIDEYYLPPKFLSLDSLYELVASGPTEISKFSIPISIFQETYISSQFPIISYLDIRSTSSTYIEDPGIETNSFIDFPTLTVSIVIAELDSDPLTKPKFIYRSIKFAALKFYWSVNYDSAEIWKNSSSFLF